MNKRNLTLIMENKPGALARVVGLFHQRGYNIESLNVGAVFDGSYSRMTVTTRASENDVEQITKQMNKIIDVIKVSDLTEGKHHEYEFILIKFNKSFCNSIFFVCFKTIRIRCDRKSIAKYKNVW